MGKKVLIIDDDPRNIFALKATLEANGFETLVAGKAEEGLELLQTQAIEVAVVLLDMMMPGMDGYQALGQIRNSAVAGTIPVIAVTAQAMKGDKEKCLAAGANDYIAKPIDVDTLMTKLNSFLH